MTNLIPRAERAIAERLVDRLLYKLDVEEKMDADKRQQQRTKTYLEILELSRHFMGEALTDEKYLSLRDYIKDPDHRWMRLIGDILDNTDPGYAKKAILSLGFEAFFRGTKEIRANREIYGCNIPWLILFDPTMACNMHCIGCWSGTYDHKDSLTYEQMDRIVSEGKELGTHLYMLTGGEPLVRKKDILKLCEKHSDCFFAAYTNSTLIDEQLCRDTLRLGNLMFLLSIEGTPDTNDARRGEGHYASVMRAMDLLRRSRIPFGISVCYTSQNIDSVTSDEFFRFVSGKGALFGFYFHYMPVGQNAVPALMPTVEQRRMIIDRIRRIRSAECDIPFFPMDFQNDGEYVGGCIAGGRNYFHINAHGDAEPCVFIHFSDSNIRDKSILEILQSPLFMAYHNGQPFNRNHLRPCPMLENPAALRKIVKETGAVQTNLEAAESVEELCSKCDVYARSWAPAAETLWQSKEHKTPAYENYAPKNRSGRS